MAYEQNSAGNYVLPSADTSPGAVDGQDGGKSLNCDVSLEGIIFPNARILLGPIPGADELRRMSARFATCSSKVFRMRTAAANAFNFDAEALSSTMLPEHPIASELSNNPQATFTPQLAPESDNFTSFSNATPGYPEAGQPSQPSFSATTGFAARDASNYAGSESGDASRYHVPSQHVPPNVSHYQEFQAPAPPLDAAGQPFYEIPLYYVNTPYGVQAVPYVVTHDDQVVEHPSLQTMGSTMMGNAAGGDGMPPHPLGAPAATAPTASALPSHFNFDFSMPSGQFAAAPMAQPQQYGPYTFGVPVHSAQNMASFTPNDHQLTELNNVPLSGSRRGRGRVSKAGSKKSTTAAAQTVDIGKENIDPNSSAGTAQPAASSSSSSTAPTAPSEALYKCLFCAELIPGTRKDVRTHLLKAHFSGGDGREYVPCTCGEKLQISSLPQHIVSGKHYGAAACVCPGCGKRFARGNLLAAHKGKCEGGLGAEPARKKQRVD